MQDELAAVHAKSASVVAVEINMSNPEVQNIVNQQLSDVRQEVKKLQESMAAAKVNEDSLWAAIQTAENEKTNLASKLEAAEIRANNEAAANNSKGEGGENGLSADDIKSLM